MRTTEFLESLTPASRDDRQTQVCDFFLFFSKGIKKPYEFCLGWVAVEGPEGSRNYYYRLEDGLLEIAVTPNGEGDFSRKITDFITAPQDLFDMLGAEDEDDGEPLVLADSGLSVPFHRPN